MTGIPSQCQGFQDQIDVLEQRIANLQVELLTAPPLQKPRILKRIGDLSQRIVELQDQLDACINPTSNLAITGVERTQATQSFNNPGVDTVSMISHRQTILRVYVDTTANLSLPTPANVSGKVTQYGNLGPHINLSPINGPIPARPASWINRAYADDTLNFRIPAAYSIPGTRFSVSVFDPDHQGDPAYTANPFQLVIGFTAVPEVRIHGILIHYTGRGLNIPPPNLSDLILTLDWVRRVYPIPGFIFTPFDVIEFDGDLTINPTDGGCGVGWEILLARLRDMRDASGTNDVFLGLLPPGVPHGGLTGCGGGPGVAIGYVNQGSVLAQEIAHALGRRKHAPCGPVGSPDPDYPVYDSYPSGSIGEFGFDVITGEVFNPASTYDYMSYCGPAWTSPYSYTGIKNAILSTQAAMHPARAGNRAVDREHLYLNFRVHTARGGKVDLLHTYILHGPGLAPETGRETPVWLRLIDADDEVIRVHHCHLANPHHDADAATFDVHEAVPWDPATQSIEFLLDGRVISRTEMEAEDPRLTVHPPERMGAEPERMRVEWDARHSKTVWYMVRYTHDGGRTWHAVDADLTSSSLVVDLDLMPGGDECAFQIVASSGLRTVTVATEPFTVKRKPRTVTILRPKTGEQFTRGTSVPLLGVGHSPDFETADFEDTMWTSNRDGYLGVGDQLTTHTLSPGRHRISVSVPDGLGGEASATVSIQIRTDQPV